MSYLAQLIYRSKATPLFRRGDMDDFVRAMSQSNERQGLTGVLLFDGEYFLQVVEGGLRQLQALLDLLKSDARHTSLVVLRLDAIKERAFPAWGMATVTLRHANPDAATRDGAAHHPSMTMAQDLTARGDDRLRLVVEAFLQGHWRDGAAQSTSHKHPVRIAPPHRLARRTLEPPAEVGFAFQPIVDTQQGRTQTLEALIRGPQGESPAEVLGRHQGADVYRFDLNSKAVAIEQFAALEVDCDLALNVLPMTLTHAKDATEFLLDALARHRIAPERLVLEVTEEEAITRPQHFIAQMQALRGTGVRVAIDDFGAGFAGLSLLSEFQPDKLKIDRTLVRDIHQHGPRQAIVRAVTHLCGSLGIEVVAEGVEQRDELLWLEGAGISRFQGFLIARPEYAGIGEVRWFR